MWDDNSFSTSSFEAGSWLFSIQQIVEEFVGALLVFATATANICETRVTKTSKLAIELKDMIVTSYRNKRTATRFGKK